MSGLLASGCTRDPVWNQTCNGFMHHFRFDSRDQFCVLFWGSSFGPHLRDSSRNGAELRGPFPAPKHAKLCLQAALFWRWMAWLERQVKPPVQPLLLNLDETALSYSFHLAEGLSVRRLRRHGRCYSQVRKHDLRGAVTHVAIIADRSEVQLKLPQLTIGNRHRFTHGLLASVGADKPAFVHLFRRESSWNNITVMCEILELLAAALQEFPSFQPTLLLDTCGCHVSDVVICKGSSTQHLVGSRPSRTYASSSTSRCVCVCRVQALFEGSLQRAAVTNRRGITGSMA